MASLVEASHFVKELWAPWVPGSRRPRRCLTPEVACILSQADQISADILAVSDNYNTHLSAVRPEGENAGTAWRQAIAEVYNRDHQNEQRDCCALHASAQDLLGSF